MSRPQPRSANVGKVNHMRLNHQQLKEAQALNKERQRQDVYAAEKKQRASENLRSKYGHVGSSGTARGDVVASTHQEPSQRQAHVPQDDVEISVYVRECDPDSQLYSFMESTVQQQPQSPPRAAAAAGNVAGNNQPYRPPRPETEPGQQKPPVTAGLPGNHTKGAVPKYLQKRKGELQAEKDDLRRRAEEEMEQSKYPPGHRPLGEDERQEMLTRLAQRKKELEWELGKIPMRYDTLSSRQRRKDIEQELLEVEGAEKKFQKKVLYVPM